MKHGGPAKSVDVVARGTGSGSLGRGTSSSARHLKLAPLAQLQLDVQSHIDCLGGGRRCHLLLQSQKREWQLGLWQDLVSLGGGDEKVSTAVSPIILFILPRNHLL